MQRTDVQNRQELEEMLRQFYTLVFDDELIGHFFTQVVPLQLEVHLPLIADFWESIVVGTRSYRKNVMEVHQHIHQLSAIQKNHLDRWVNLFTQTVDENFAGPKAELMKQRARSIAMLMDVKLNHGGIHQQ